MVYKMTIGLETHVELNTNTKIFCSCKVAHGGNPNTRCCPVCLGMPGTLPSVNKKVVDYAVMAGIALNTKIRNISKMARKNYMYPDLPKGYQITQNTLPLCYDGYVFIDNKKIRINRIHIEEDAGKIIRNNDEIYIDYNRAGVPLIEIVTEPDFTSANQVRDYLDYIRLTMKHLSVSDCRMQEGSLRCDVNISVNGNAKCEIKNLNSVNNIVNAINAEFKRQTSIIESGGKIHCATLRYNDTEYTTEIMRYKETSAEYRYFDDPDLPAIEVTNERIDMLKELLPLSINELSELLITKYKLSCDEADNLLRYPKATDFFIKLCDNSEDTSLVYDTIFICLYKYFSVENEREDFSLPLDDSVICELISNTINGIIPRRSFEKTLMEMLKNKKGFYDLYTDDDFKTITDYELFEICIEVVKSNPKMVSDFLNGKEKALSPMIGMVMNKTKGRADPAQAKNTLKRIIFDMEV